MKYLFFSLILTMGLFGLDCENAMTTIDMQECAQQEYQIADKRLNVAYKKLMESLDETAKVKLVNAQKKWIGFRDSEAEFIADIFRDGTAQGLLYSNAKTELTQHRTKVLEQHFQDRN